MTDTSRKMEAVSAEKTFGTEIDKKRLSRMLGVLLEELLSGSARVDSIEGLDLEVTIINAYTKDHWNIVAGKVKPFIDKIKWELANLRLGHPPN